jgi:hypothetical protein
LPLNHLPVSPSYDSHPPSRQPTYYSPGTEDHAGV